LAFDLGVGWYWFFAPGGLQVVWSASTNAHSVRFVSLSLTDSFFLLAGRRVCLAKSFPLRGSGRQP
jgi:hypothetical protein